MKSTTTTYGKLESETLLYKGKYYKIRYITVECIILDTDKLFGQYGDEFPLSLVK